MTYDANNPMSGWGAAAQTPWWGGNQPAAQPMVMGNTLPTFNPDVGVPSYQLGNVTPDPNSGGRGFFDSTNMDGTKTQGYGGMALGAASGLFNAWMGMKQYGLAKQQLAEGKRQFALNYDAQRTTTNSQLQDRQAARVASNPNAYQSVGDYMNANGIKPAGG